jgi:hypothetical protein
VLKAFTALYFKFDSVHICKTRVCVRIGTNIWINCYMYSMFRKYVRYIKPYNINTTRELSICKKLYKVRLYFATRSRNSWYSIKQKDNPAASVPYISYNSYIILNSHYFLNWELLNTNFRDTSSAHSYPWRQHLIILPIMMEAHHHNSHNYTDKSY